MRRWRDHRHCRIGLAQQENKNKKHEAPPDGPAAANISRKDSVDDGDYLPQLMASIIQRKALKWKIL
jgi:hypothetical protein